MNTDRGLDAVELFSEVDIALTVVEVSTNTDDPGNLGFNSSSDHIWKIL